jgi:hypothetical protein
MTPREIILANLAHDAPERVGLTFSRGRINDMAFFGLGPSKTYRQRRWTEGDHEFYDDEWGNVWVRMVGGSQKGEVHTPAVADWSQLDSLRLPDFDDPDRFAPVRQKMAEPTDKFKIFFMPGWVFATSRYLRKMEVYFVDLIAHPEEIHRLHEMVTSLLVRVIDLAGGCGAEGVFFAEDLGVQDRPLIGPAMWREMFGRHYRRLTQAAHERGMKVLMHSCGYNWALIDDLVAAGIDGFQFDQPAAYDMPALAEKLRRHKVGLWSPVDIQQVLPTGDRALIEAEAQRMLKIFRGGLIMKDYPDLPGIGVAEEWDQWAYRAILAAEGLDDGGA